MSKADRIKDLREHPTMADMKAVRPSIQRKRGIYRQVEKNPFKLIEDVKVYKEECEKRNARFVSMMSMSVCRTETF